MGKKGLLEGTEELCCFWFLLCMSLWDQGGWGSGGVWSRTVSVSVSQGNYTPATIVCENALRSDHLTADMADNKRKILQCWELAVDKHLFSAELHGFTKAVKLFLAVIQGRVCVVNKT